MRPPPSLSAAAAHRSLAGLLAAASITFSPMPPLSQIAPAFAAAAPPSADAQAGLRRAFTAAQAGLSSTDALFGESIAEWERTQQPAEEIAQLYKARGGVRLEQSADNAPQLRAALSDLTKALELMQTPGSKTEPAELQRTFQLRARVNGALGNPREQIGDLSSAISLLDALDAIEATNPYVYGDRARARMVVGDYRGAADDAEAAEMLFKDIGDKIRRTMAAADGALASYGAGDARRRCNRHVTAM